MKREANITPLIEKFLKQNKIYCNYEVKQTTTDSIPFSNVPDHQINSLIAAQEEGISHKYSDADPRIKPCDGSNNPPLPGYIIIKYPKAFVLITVNNFIHARIANRKKSLTFEKACDIAEKIVY
jgi:hypothetical protein